MLAAGTQLDPYRILAPLGAGGMGEVYLAEDTRLGRKIALKVLPAQFTADAERVRRFVQEAKAASALDHPNILIVHDIGTHDGSPYIVSELLEGETLRDRLNTGALPMRKAVDCGLQIAHGLAAAHGKGIIHRDLKPENLFICHDGRVKILDFGLAKLKQPSGSGSFRGKVNVEDSTETHNQDLGTDPGKVMGTVGYMAPEQVRGQEADHRTDIFAVGVVLYEMLAGKRAFAGQSAVETMNAILKEEPPDLAESNEKIAPGLVRVVSHCLEKNPQQRFQSASDLAFALEALSGISGSTSALSATAAVEQTRKQKPFAWILTTVALALALLATLLFTTARFHQVPTDTRVMKFSISAPEKASLRRVAVSPDGRWLAFTAAKGGSTQLWVRSLDALASHALPGTEGAGYPFWSPDSRFIGFFTLGQVKKIGVSDGAVQTVCDAAGTGRGGAWNRDGVIVFATVGSGLSRVSAAGGEVTAVTTIDSARQETGHFFPSFLPDGRHFLYDIMSPRKEYNGIHLGSLNQPLKRRLLTANSTVLYAASSHETTGYLLFDREGALLAQPFDARELKLAGEPVPVPIAERVWRFSASDNGLLVYNPSVNRQSKQLVWMDRQGKQIGSLGVVPVSSKPCLSPDGRRVVVDRRDERTGNWDLWLYDAAGRGSSSFTFDSADDIAPVWSPDGSRIVWCSTREGTSDLYWKAASGAGQDEVLFKSSSWKTPTDWSLDGRFIIYQEIDPKTKRDVWVLPMSGDRKPFPFLHTESDEAGAQLSPDGRWMAYISDETRRYEVYVQSFPTAGGKRQISTKGGLGPQWRRDGKELFYYASDGKLMAVEVKSEASFEPGVARELFEFPSGSDIPALAPYSVSGDGKQFLINALVDESGGASLTVVVNWMAGLKR